MILIDDRHFSLSTYNTRAGGMMQLRHDGDSSVNTTILPSVAVADISEASNYDGQWRKYW